MRDAVARSLAEDRVLEDVTTQATVPPDQSGRGSLLVKRDGVLCGLDAAREVFRQLGGTIAIEARAADGDAVACGQVVATRAGPLSTLLSGERVALNFLQRLSGIATLTRAFVERAAEGGTARITDTRKTTPGLRALERYAVRAGGGHNHRDTLADLVLIKDNHLAAAAARGVALPELRREVRERAPHTHRIEVEAPDVETALLAIEAGADIVMLDNMTVAAMREAVEAAAGRAVLEASGGVNLESVRKIAATGVDLISVGALTHSAPALDISLEVEPA
ncbi:MAG: carboxylating nicotinate-nucleotide diphosphorylase [Chloroflexi bacterium]|nr:carboxylating nicotinate-nucleotide diphosphorylase [Chloroflexota bacterium]